MTEIRNAAGNVTSFTLGDVLGRYRAGDRSHMSFDAAAFMAGTLGNNVRPTSFDAFSEVSAYVASTGQSISIDQYFTNKYNGLLASDHAPTADRVVGGEITTVTLSSDEYVTQQSRYGYQSYFDGDFSTQGRFDKYVWGSTSYLLRGTISASSLN